MHRPLPRPLNTFTIALLSLLVFTGAAGAQDKPAIEVVPITGHGQSVTKAAFSPDGTRVLTGSWDGTMKLWDAASGRLIRTFVAGTDVVYSVAYSPDGARVAAACGDKTVKIWDAASGRLVVTLRGHRDGVSSVAFLPGGSRIASGSFDNTVKVWDAASGRTLQTFTGHNVGVDAIAVSPDGTRLASTASAVIRIWDLASGRLALTINQNFSRVLSSLAFSPDGRQLLAGVGDIVGIWNAATGVLMRTFEGHTDSVQGVAFSPDGALAGSVSYDKTLRLWSVTTGQLFKKFDVSRYPSIAFAPDGKGVLWADGNSATLTDIANGEVLQSFEGYSLPVVSVAMSPDGSRALWAGGDSLVKLVDLASGRLVRAFEGHKAAVTSVAFSRDGTQVLSSSYDRTLRLWDAATGRTMATFNGHEKGVMAGALSPDGTRVLSGDLAGVLKLWDAATGAPVRTLGRHTDVRSVAFSPDGTRLLSGGLDRTVKLWDARSGQVIRTFGGNSHFILAVAFSPDGTLVAAGTWDKPIKLWEAGSGRLVRMFEGHFDYVTSLAFSPDGSRLVSGSLDRTTKLWETASGRLVRTFTAPAPGTSVAQQTNLTGNRYIDPVETGGIAVAFSSDGRRILAGSSDSTIKIWNVASGASPVTFFNLPDGEWLAMTDAGFFASSPQGSALLSIVHGLDAAAIQQLYDHLYRPDLVGEALKGDLEGNHKDAAFHLNLEKVVGSGPAPQIEYLEQRTERAGDTVRLAVRITDVGGGIGKMVVWRVNGVTQGNPMPPQLAATPPPDTAVITQTLRVDPGRANKVEVTAYNGPGLVATPPFTITVDRFGTTAEERPRMHVLAIGVDRYRMKDYELRYAVRDAEAFATALETVGSNLFARVSVTRLLNEQVTRERIAAAFDRIAADAKPADVFVLFLGGHGKSIAGRYYYYPHSLDFAAGQNVEQHGIGQDLWQQWLAKLPVQKTLMILDTCESGAAVGLVRGADSARQTAMDQLQHATGHNLIAATRAAQAAYEGYKGHGVLTYALLEALVKRDDGGADDRVRVGTLADHVDARVPSITREIWGMYQQPTRKLTGNDFPIGIRSAALTVQSDDAIPVERTHVLVRAERLREKAADDAPGQRELRAGFEVGIVRLVGPFALIARDGQKLGYVPVEALAKRE